VIEVIKAAAELQAVCQSQGWRFCFIGGIAVLRWGEPRETIDVDLTLLTGFGGEEPFIQTLLDHFDARIENAAAFARQRRVLLLRTAKGVGLDISLAGLPFEETVVQRSSVFDYPPNVSLRTCSAEDLIVLKSFAGRGQDWVDVERIIVRQTGKLDWRYIYEQLAPLAELKGAPEILDQLKRRRQEFER
jgi:hypothetical protein